jgi:hypothetical protein
VTGQQRFLSYNRENEELKTHRRGVSAPFNQLLSETIASERSLNVNAHHGHYEKK